jgi:ABC-type uncharacterized transport system substrate-binding protein
MGTIGPRNRFGWIAGVAVVLVVLGVAWGLRGWQSSAPPANVDKPAPYAGKRIFWVDSYHEGNPWNDGIGRGIRQVLQGSGVVLQAFHMDAARNAGDAYGQQVALKTKAAIDAFKPDVLIATDDAAQKYVMVPFYRDAGRPIVFAGVNWSAEAYGYPTPNVTGMLEVDLVDPLVRALREYARGDRVAYLSGDTQTQAKVVATYNERFFGGKMQFRLVKSFDEFKQAFVALQGSADMLLTGNYAGIAGWDDKAARAFIVENTRIPTGYVDGYMTPLVLITMGKIPEEQGEYAAQVALAVLGGAKPSAYPLVSNKKAALGLNLVIADKLQIVFTPAMLKNAGTVYREAR